MNEMRQGDIEIDELRNIRRKEGEEVRTVEELVMLE